MELILHLWKIMTLYYIENLSFCVYLFMNLWSKSYSFYSEDKIRPLVKDIGTKDPKWHVVNSIIYLYIYIQYLLQYTFTIPKFPELDIRFTYLRFSLKYTDLVKCIHSVATCYYDISSIKIMAIKYVNIQMHVCKS